jgi:hypothetical protein
MCITRSSMKKSQSSTEFMIFIGIAIIILMSYFAITNNYLNLIYKQKDIISGQDLAKQIKNEINLASRIENNYERTFTLPSMVGNNDYIVNIEGREINVKIEGLDYVELLSTDVDAITFNPKDTVIIQKMNDKVIVSKDI